MIATLNSISIPLRLTFARLFGGLLIMPVLIYLLLPYNHFVLNCLVGAIFFGFVFTDLLDGFFARRNNQVSAFGAFLDPIADKCLIITTSLTLLSINKMAPFFVGVVVLRELIVMSFRQLALEHNQQLTVSFVGKCKMFMQSIYILFLIITPYYDAWYEEVPLYFRVHYVLLFATVGVTLLSGLLYIHRFFNMTSLLRLHDWNNDADRY